MKQHFLATTLLVFLTEHAIATENDWLISFHAESLDCGKAASLRMHTGEFLYGGMSLNYIDSCSVIQDRDRKTIYPFMLYMGLKYPAEFTPFIEAGVDFPELLFDEAFDDEDNSIDLTDYYITGGMEFSISERYSIVLYARKYVFKYHQSRLDISEKFRADSYGAGLTMHF